MSALTPEDVTRGIRSAGFATLTVDAVGSPLDVGDVKMYPVSINGLPDATTQYFQTRYPELSGYNNIVAVSKHGSMYIRFM